MLEDDTGDELTPTDCRADDPTLIDNHIANDDDSFNSSPVTTERAKDLNSPVREPLFPIPADPPKRRFHFRSSVPIHLIPSPRHYAPRARSPYAQPPMVILLA